MPRRYFRSYLATEIDPLRDDWFSNNLSRTDTHCGRAIIRDTFFYFADISRYATTAKNAAYRAIFLSTRPFALFVAFASQEYLSMTDADFFYIRS